MVLSGMGRTSLPLRPATAEQGEEEYPSGNLAEYSPEKEAFRYPPSMSSPSGSTHRQNWVRRQMYGKLRRLYGSC